MTIKPLAEFEGQNYTLEEMIQVYELIERSLKHAISNLTAGVDPNDKRNVKLLASSIIARIIDMTEDEIKKLKLLSEINESVEDKLSEVYERFEGESDVICRMVDAHRLLKRDHEKDHLLTMTMYNEYRKSKENWKQIDKYMEENENDDKAVS